MNFVFAPSESRAQDFLKNNRFGLDDRVKVRTASSRLDGERYCEGDTLYILDGCPSKMLASIQINSMISPTKPAVISVEER
ncbi:hypothetical protein [Micromonospora sp. CB01531]|uniref:hypothetical protein n=1 Tax=Micromonospora sp. CB01531 TaxID=1718947 RepID=UPI00093AA0DB|nr:hypothetical protein [Micromonospora sp. CB01531]OKI54520.1 hypothetical protein A6A27_31845 [Micromonospora sp. CB01531]